MKTYIKKRVAVAAVSLLAVLLLLFLLMDFLPGTPFNDEKLGAAQIAVLKAEYGLDKPAVIRFFNYIGHMITGDFGLSYSIGKNMPVGELIADRFWLSLKIGGLAVTAGMGIGLLIGVGAALKKNKAADWIVGAITVLGVSMPSYVAALAFSYVLGFRMKWFPILYRPGQPGFSAVLPAAALSLPMAAAVARTVRAEMIEILESDYMMFAVSRGIPFRRRIWVHGLKNVMVPVIAVASPLAAVIMTGSLAVEKVFSIPGAGSLMVNAIQSNDYNVTAALAFLYSLLYIGFSLVSDLLFQWLNPRIRFCQEEK
ncbi:MAG: ABC transporter permease [Lachnoclostridium edouardi]|uniref:ABC transporter permease n=1 Tax=Lachnoclostridium edouardi TaxID=1926283 RepID=UPI0026DD9CC7|nr:ABC transporter permease [Lachnoclostridium edouardi]MDO4278345.1 ABC transporter permease [Lachnoclostridium edouardi]